MATQSYYAVAVGKQVGVFLKWDECRTSIERFPGARYKKFDNEREARQFVADNLIVPGGRPYKVEKSTTPSDSSLPASSSRKRGHSPKTDEVQPLKMLKDEYSDAQVIYTDGACSNNGKSTAKAGWGVFWGAGHENNDWGPVYGEATNNRGEFIAVEKALEKAIAKNLKKIVIRTDSNLLIQSLTTWIHGWKKKGWKTAQGTAVKNQDVLIKLDGLMKKIDVKFEHVFGHTGVEGNERADELARLGATMYV